MDQARLLKKLLSGGNIELIELNGTENPAFPNIKQPEPTEENLKILSGFIKHNNASIGLATDGDADRLGIVDSNGDSSVLWTYLCSYVSIN
ncbi:MAG: hypothetical protein CM1200mP37_4090 [Chloroflexota bacterium]|nr:MAG: hypothetical protein CM1200mP37_4090 [Chloroflexota bacterium]